jgi:hypothetical protein
VLTGIVVAVSATALALAFGRRLDREAPEHTSDAHGGVDDREEADPMIDRIRACRRAAAARRAPRHRASRTGRARLGMLTALATTGVALWLTLMVWSGETPAFGARGLGRAARYRVCARTGWRRRFLTMANLVALAISINATGYFGAARIAPKASGRCGCCSGPRSTGSSWPPISSISM